MPQPRLPGFESGGPPPPRSAPDAARRPKAGAEESSGAPEVLLYADGACSGNPGPGGWGAILVDTRTGKARELSGSDPQTTNNRMELTAVIAALRSLPRPGRVRVVTDSRYVVDGMREWLPRWMRNGWKTSSRKPVKNQDLWEELSRLDTLHSIEFTWIEGHSGHPENERCDQLAVEAYRKLAR